MSASMAEVLAEHVMADADSCTCDEMFYDYRLAPEQIKVEHSLHVEERLAANGYGKLEDAKAPEVRYATLTNGETELDEIVAQNASVHLEAMDDNHWWMAIESGGTRIAVNLYTKRAKITAHAEED